jgi:hypothetical protein
MSTSQNSVDPSHPSDAAMLREQTGAPSTGSFLTAEELASMSQLNPADLVSSLANSREPVPADSPLHRMSNDQLRDAMQKSMKAVQDFRSVKQSVDRLEQRSATSNDVTGLVGFPAFDSAGNAIIDMTGSEYEKAERAADLSRRSAARAGVGDFEYDQAVAQLHATAPNARPPATASGAPYEITRTPSGGYDILIDSGEHFVGKDADEIIAKLTHSKRKTGLWGRDLSAQLKQLQNGQPQPNVQQSTQPMNVPAMQLGTSGQQPNPNQPGWDTLGELPNESSRWILDNMVAKPLGFSDSAELVGAWQGMQQQIAQQNSLLEDYRNDRTAMEFMAAHPEFPGDDRSADILLDVLDRSGLPYTAGNLELAHTLAVSKGVYRALSPAEIRAANGEAPQNSGRQVPPPPPPQNNPDGTQWNVNPWQQSTDELRKQLLAGGGLGRALLDLKAGETFGG